MQQYENSGNGVEWYVSEQAWEQDNVQDVYYQYVDEEYDEEYAQ